jgi:hypothetical protein
VAVPMVEGAVSMAAAEAVVSMVAVEAVASTAAVGEVPAAVADFHAAAEGDIVEAAPSEARALLALEATTGAEALAADQPRAATERTGVRTADSALREA